MLRQIQRVALLTACLLTAGCCCCGPGPVSCYDDPSAGAYAAAWMNSPLGCPPCDQFQCCPAPPCCGEGYYAAGPSFAAPGHLGATPGGYPAGGGEMWSPGSPGPALPSTGPSGYGGSISPGVDEGVQRPPLIPEPVPAETPLPAPPDVPPDAGAFDTRGVRRANLEVLPPAAVPLLFPDPRVSQLEVGPPDTWRQAGSAPLPLIIPAATH